MTTLPSTYAPTLLRISSPMSWPAVGVMQNQAVGDNTATTAPSVDGQHATERLMGRCPAPDPVTAAIRQHPGCGMCTAGLLR